ncbi:MAG: hypothetical protein K8U57_40650 [Planctomycetes bacterium]|nr:hypothetical protein [Planctomycetota bacterium]
MSVSFGQRPLKWSSRCPQFCAGKKTVPGDMPTPPPEPFYLSGMTIIIVIAKVIEYGVWAKIHVSDELISGPESAQINTGNATSGTLM